MKLIISDLSITILALALLLWLLLQRHDDAPARRAAQISPIHPKERAA